MSKDECPAGGEHEFVVLKKERMPSGKTKLIQKCKKCGKFFETTVSEA
jgi:uncharacterized Zn finger protein